MAPAPWTARPQQSGCEACPSPCLPPRSGTSCALLTAARSLATRLAVHSGQGCAWQDLQEVDLVLLQRHGRFSGEAVVVLADGEQVLHALHKDKGHLGRRYIDVFPASRVVMARRLGTSRLGLALWVREGQPAEGPAAHWQHGVGSARRHEQGRQRVLAKARLA